MAVPIRPVFFWAHLSCGVAAGLVVAFMSVTGVLLACERQIVSWADRRALAPMAPGGGARLSPSELVSRVTAAGNEPPASVTLRRDPDAPVELSFGPQRTLFVDPRTGASLGEGDRATRRLFRRLTEWHRWLGATEGNRATARAITGASNLLFLFLVVSGAVLWLPPMWTKVRMRQTLWFRRGLAGRARDFNWHHAIGVWSLLPLFVIVVSGVVMSYPWASDAVYRLAGEAPPAIRQQPPPADGRERQRAPGVDAADLDAGFAIAEAHVGGWQSISVRLPSMGPGPLLFSIDAGGGGQPQRRGQLAVRSGEVVSWEPFDSQTRGRRWRSFLRFAHTGEYWGAAGQAVAGLVSAGAVVLVWTGWSLAFRRLLGGRRKASADRPEERERVA